MSPRGERASFNPEALRRSIESAGPSGFAMDCGFPAFGDFPFAVFLGHGWPMLPSSMARAVFDRLTSAPVRRFVEIGEGTHVVFLERNRFQLFREVQLFLEEVTHPEAGRSSG